MSDIRRLARPAVLQLPPVDVAGAPLAGAVRLDANENPYLPLVSGQPEINRYPEPQPERLRRRMADLYGIAAERLWVTRGSDDAIDLIIRTFCEAGSDKVGIIEPTFSAYAHFARLQGAKVVAARLTDEFKFDVDGVIAAMSRESPKLLFLCTPNNPTGTRIAGSDIRQIAAALPDAIVVVDEAYGEFSGEESLAPEADGRLVVLRTLSKAYGLAGARIGCLVGSPELVELVSRASPPYPLPGPSIAAALDVLGPERMPVHRARIEQILTARERIAAQLAATEEVLNIRQGGNFLFLEVADPAGLARRLATAAVRVRFRPNAAPGGVRVTVGTTDENAVLLSVFGLTGPRTERRAELVRDTNETRIALALNLDRSGERSIDSGVRFYDHMLEQLAAHGNFSLTLTCAGDTDIDAHHSIEDVAITLGQAFRKALGAKQGIGRYGFALPMDEAQARVVVDLSGRPYSRFEGSFSGPRVGDLPTEMVPHIFRSLADSMAAAIHVQVDGDNDHHKAEACFKALGRALRQAVTRAADDPALPSTKGML